MGVDMAHKKKDMSRQALLLLVVAVLVVSLVGTWLVLSGSFEGQSASSRGTISFSKTGGQYTGPIMERNPDSAGKLAFVKQG